MMYRRNEWLKLDGNAADLSEEAKDLRAVLLPTEQSPSAGDMSVFYDND